MWFSVLRKGLIKPNKKKYFLRRNRFSKARAECKNRNYAIQI